MDALDRRVLMKRPRVTSAPSGLYAQRLARLAPESADRLRIGALVEMSVPLL